MGNLPQDSSTPPCEGRRTDRIYYSCPRVWRQTSNTKYSLKALNLPAVEGLETETGAVNLALAATLTTSHHRSLLGRHRCELPPRFVDNTREATVADLKDLRSVG